MIVHYLDASAIGGIETHVGNVALAQMDAGHRVIVLLHAGDAGNPVSARYRKAGIETRFAGSVAGLFSFLRRERPAILHTHGYKAGILGRPAARLLAIPVISTFHAGERGPGRVALYQSLDEWTSFLGTRLAVSQAIADALPFGAAVMRNFVSPAPVIRPVPASPRLVFAGRLSHEKGPDLFCELAAANAGRANWDLHGEGPLRQELERAHAGAVKFHGFTPDMDSALNSATALVMTSRNEGLPMIALEAMARGVPVIAPRLGALPELIADCQTGYLFEPGDMAGLAQALDRLLALDPAGLAAMGERTRTTIARFYSPGAVLPRLLAAYAEAGFQPALPISANVQSSAG